MICMLLFISLGAFAQDPEKTDSLLENYFASLSNDTNKVNQLYKSGYDLRTKDISAAFKYADACLLAANEATSDKHLAKANNLLGVLNFRTGKLDKALQYHNTALLLREKIKDEEGIAFSKLNIANIYSDQNLKQKAEALYLEAMQLFNKVGNKKLLANTLNNIGIIQFEKKEYKTAENYFRQALKIGEELNDYELKAFTYNNLGTVYENLKDFVNAKIYFEEALELRELMGNEIEQVDTYINIASTSFELKNYTQSKELLFKALQISNTNEYSEGNLSIYNFLKDIYIVENKYDSALYYQTKYYELKEKSIAESDESFDKLRNPSNGKEIVIDDSENQELKKENHLLKYLIGVLAVFLVILFLAIKRLK